MKPGLFITLLLLSSITVGQPIPGDFFREYTWTVPELDNNTEFLRVGGGLDYHTGNFTFAEGHYKDGITILNSQSIRSKLYGVHGVLAI